MTDQPIDAALADLATLQEGFEDRFALLEEMSHALLDQPPLGAQLVARILASAEEAPELTDMSDLLGHALETARMASEGGQKRGDRFLLAVVESLELAARQGSLELWQRVFFASLWARSGLQAPAVLVYDPGQGARAPSAQEAAALDEMVEELFADLEEAFDANPPDMHATFAEIFPTIPAAARPVMVQLALGRPEPAYGQLGILWLLDPDPALRLAAAEGLAARQAAGHLTRETLADLIMVRSWIPRDASHAFLDQILGAGLRAAPSAAKSPRPWRIGEILASLPDGAGGQSISISLQSGRQRSFAMVLLKQKQGVKDAFVLPAGSAAAQKAMARQIIDDTGALAATAEWLEQTLAMAIAEGLENGRPPAAGLIEIARVCGFEALRPQAISTGELVTSLATNTGVAEMTPRGHARLDKLSTAWWDRHYVADSWFEQNDRVHERLEQAEGAAACKAAVWEELEARRDWWTATVARAAHLLEAADHPDLRTFVMTAMALEDGKDLRKISFMTLVHEQTIDAWLDANPDAEIEDDDFDVEVEPPEPERKGEVAQIVRGSDISSDWIDGFLMAVGITPAPIPPHEWAGEIVTRVMWTMDRTKLQRFLALLTMRVHLALDQASDRHALTSRLKQRSKKGKLAWATGFSHGYRRFRSFWPARSLAADDRKMIQLIAKAEKASFEPEDIRAVGLWIEARQARNLSDD